MRTLFHPTSYVMYDCHICHPECHKRNVTPQRKHTWIHYANVWPLQTRQINWWTLKTMQQFRNASVGKGGETVERKDSQSSNYKRVTFKQIQIVCHATVTQVTLALTNLCPLKCLNHSCTATTTTCCVRVCTCVSVYTDGQRTNRHVVWQTQ
jgi:hypothetical protein